MAFAIFVALSSWTVNQYDQRKLHKVESDIVMATQSFQIRKLMKKVKKKKKKKEKNIHWMKLDVYYSNYRYNVVASFADIPRTLLARKKGRYVSLIQKTLLKNDRMTVANNDQENNIVWNDKFSRFETFNRNILSIELMLCKVSFFWLEFSSIINQRWRNQNMQTLLSRVISKKRQWSFVQNSSIRSLF